MTHDFFLTKKARKVTKSAKNKTTKNCKKNAISAEKGQQVGFHSIGATIRTRQESRCLPYAGFFKGLLTPQQIFSPILYPK